MSFYLDDIMKNALNELKLRKDNLLEINGVQTGLSSLDRVTSGFQNGELIVLGCSLGMGKSSFILTAIRNAAIDHKIPSCLFSITDSSFQFANRLISSESKLDSLQIRKGRLSNYKMYELEQTVEKISKAPIYIDDSQDISLEDLSATSRFFKSQYDIGFIIIDNLQLLVSNLYDKGNQESHDQKLAFVTHALKALAEELQVPILLISNLSQALVERKERYRPSLSDLGESRAIEKNADVVMFLYRPDYYDLNEYEDGSPAKNTIEIMVVKNRKWGSDNYVRLKFMGKYSRIVELDNFEFDVDEPIPL